MYEQVRVEDLCVAGEQEWQVDRDKDNDKESLMQAACILLVRHASHSLCSVYEQVRVVDLWRASMAMAGR